MLNKTNFKFWNNITGWMVFFIATITYLLTIEPTTSLWDCSEFIAVSYKLEVGHKGYPVLAQSFGGVNVDLVWVAAV